MQEHRRVAAHTYTKTANVAGKSVGYFGATAVVRNVIFCLVEGVCRVWCGVNFVRKALAFYCDVANARSCTFRVVVRKFLVMYF